MSIFDLSPDDQQALKQQVQMTSIDGTKPLPPMGFAGLGEASKALAGAGAHIDQGILGAGLAATASWDTVAGLASGDPYYHDATDWWAKNAVQGFGNTIVDTWTPDPAKMGASSRFLSNLFGVAGAVPFMAAAPALYLNSTAFAPALELSDKGASTGAALTGGAISLGINALGFKLPPTVGNTLGQRVLAGAGINEALGIGHDAAMHAVLAADGDNTLAQQYDWTNWQQRGMDGVMGAVFGALGHPAAEREKNATLAAIGDQLAQDTAVRNVAKDALLTQLGGMHFGAASMPGAPTSLGAMARGQSALSAAIGQTLRGEPVQVDGIVKPGDFTTPQPAAPAQDFTSYRRALESSGNPNARNPNSSAAGIDQFTNGTWLTTVKAAAPAWADGLSDKDLLALRLDPSKSGEMAAVLTEANARRLRDAGLPANNETLYAAWHFGAGKAIEFLNANASTPTAKLFSADVLKANPYLKGKTVGDVLANWNDRAAGRDYTVGIAARNDGEDDKAYAKRVIDQLPEPTAAQLPDDPARYFTDTDVAQSIPLDNLVSSKTEAENAQGGANGLKRMAAAGEGVLGKRAPIDVQDNGDGSFTVVDGNGTLTAAQKAGFANLPARIVRAVVPDNPELQARYDAASDAYPSYVKDMSDVAASVGGRFVNPGLKSVSRALEKLPGYGGDASRIKDLLRGTIELPDHADVGVIEAALRERYGEPVGTPRNSLRSDSPPLDASGYRDFKAVFKVNGQPVEMQANVPEMLAAKAQAHVPYEERSRIINKAENEGRDWTPAEAARIGELNQAMAAVFKPAWRAATARSNAAFVIGEPSSRNVLARARTGVPDDQSRQRPFVQSNDHGASLTNPNVAFSGKLGNPDSFDFRGIGASAIRGTSKSSIPEIGEGKPFAETVETGAASVAEAHPDMPVVLEDGTKTTAAEALKQADDEVFQVAHDSRALEAAALCAARHGDAI